MRRDVLVVPGPLPNFSFPARPEITKFLKTGRRKAAWALWSGWVVGFQKAEWHCRPKAAVRAAGTEQGERGLMAVQCGKPWCRERGKVGREV